MLVGEALVLLLVIETFFTLHVLVLGLLCVWCFIWSFLVLVSSAVGFDVANNINVSLVDVLENSHAGHHSLADGSVDSNNLDSVSWLDEIYEVLIGTHGKGLWSLTFWYRFWGLLHLDMLLITEHAKIVHHFKSESAIAVFANFWLGDFSALDIFAFFALALGAPEGGLLHLWSGIRSSNNNTLQSNEFVNVRWVKLTDLVNLSQVERSYLDDLLVLVCFWHVRVLSIVVFVLIVVNDVFLVNLHGNQIKNWNDVCWVILKLSIQRSVELENVITVNIQSVLFSLGNLFEEGDVVRLLIKISIILHSIQVLVFIIDNGESSQEFFEFGLEIVGIYIGAPEDLSVTAHLISVVNHISIQIGSREIGLLRHSVVESWSVQKSAGVQESTLSNEVRHLTRSIQNTKMAEN